ncbi:MAG: glycosyltransferase family 4 protein [Flavobacteriales bacterium]|nr:glycosyltransferase family 4 protein [Flavobacteriales bacterium]
MNKSKSNLQIIIYHVGARDYYSVSEVFDAKENLKFLITDYWFSKWNFLKIFNKSISRRNNSTINNSKVKSYNFLKIIFTELSKKRNSNKFNKWIFTGKKFTSFVIKTLKDNLKEENRYILWGYTAGNLEVLKEFKNKKNVFLLHNQIDPGLVYYEIEDLPNHVDKTNFLNRVTEEWDLADVILVNSKYSKKCLVEKKVDEKKVIVVPLIYKKNNLIQNKEFNKRLNIAFVGNITKLKGFDTFLKIAIKLHNKFNFIAVGNIHYNEKFVNEAKKYVEFKGFLDRDSLNTLYEKIDLLLFPTLCDGFGMVQLEAMSYGIPVISSTNCADVVIDNKNGFIASNTDEYIDKINYLNENRTQLKEFSENSLNRIKDFSEENFLEELNKGLVNFNIKI